MSSDILGIVVLGAGRWGAHLIRNFLQHPRAHLVAIVDPSEARLKALAHTLDLDSSIRLETDWQAAFDLPGITGVAIATPAATHYPLIRAALLQGYHVLAEKPLTLEADECLELCRLAKTQNRQLVVDHTYLFHPAVQKGRMVIEQGLLGNLRYGYASRTHLGPVRQDVDVLWDLAIHDIAIFNHWLHATPVQVQAQGHTWLQPTSPSQAAGTDLFPQGLSDLTWIKLVYPSGFQAMIHLCWLNPDKQRRLSAVGDRGTLIFDELASTTPLVLQQGHIKFSDQHWVPADHHHQAIPLDLAEPLQRVCDHFLTCAQTNTPCTISSGEVGTQLVKILTALTRSLNQNGIPIDLSS